MANCNQDCLNCPFPTCILERKSDPDKNREAARRYRESHRKAYNAYHRDYYNRNRDKILARLRERYTLKKAAQK